MTLSKMIRSAFVIARRDFTATVISKTFLLFLLGPLFPLIVGVGFGGLGAQAGRNATPATVAVVGPQDEFDLLSQARVRLSGLAGPDQPLVMLRQVDPAGDPARQRQRLLASEKSPVLGVLEGGLMAPRFTGAVSADGNTVRQVRLFVSEAQQARILPTWVERGVEVRLTKSSAGSVAFSREITARIGQTLLFVLTILLAGMLLSQLIEEKSSKVIEVLAAAIPVESIFIGKLFAMLAMAWVGILVWTSVGAVAIATVFPGGLAALPAPAVGWPMFIALGVIYFSMSYLLIGSMFLGIGSQASTVREVQTLSMPVTMVQIMIFALATLGVGQPDSASAIAGAVFPLSSPLAMIGRAAELPALLPHLAALAWQILWVALILRLSARLFRRSVLKSGPAFRWPWQRRLA